MKKFWNNTLGLFGHTSTAFSKTHAGFVGNFALCMGKRMTCVRNKACHWNATARFSSVPGCNLGYWLSHIRICIQGPTRSSHGITEHARSDAVQTAPCNSSVQCGLSRRALYLTHMNSHPSMFADDHTHTNTHINTYIHVRMQIIIRNCTTLYCKKQHAQRFTLFQIPHTHNIR